MNTDDVLKLVIERLNGIHSINDRLARIETRFEGVDKSLEKMEAHDLVQNKLLDEHIAGVKTNQARLEIEILNRKDLETRIMVLEAVPRALATLKTMFLYIAGIVAAILTLAASWYKFKA
jgi:hypothetical protein